ncbi:unnamed protein product [Rotaria sp. Silwood2]|nr:unnamed protein product [Rotaria sp. Silwood2]CAF3247473.1 unnamed protein product [Rotaria sp. Silwood2]CAF3862653.1 unnamed protein product [Rotaria sp. Silwood2]CAF3961157.1 unnamed protein product [Rotaria sp. Silwood2]
MNEEICSTNMDLAFFKDIIIYLLLFHVQPICQKDIYYWEGSGKQSLTSLVAYVTGEWMHTFRFYLRYNFSSGDKYFKISVPNIYIEQFVDDLQNVYRCAVPLGQDIAFTA